MPHKLERPRQRVPDDRAPQVPHVHLLRDVWRREVDQHLLRRHLRRLRPALQHLRHRRVQVVPAHRDVDVPPRHRARLLKQPRRKVQLLDDPPRNLTRAQTHLLRQRRQALRNRHRVVALVLVRLSPLDQHRRRLLPQLRERRNDRPPHQLPQRRLNVHFHIPHLRSIRPTHVQRLLSSELCPLLRLLLPVLLVTLLLSSFFSLPSLLLLPLRCRCRGLRRCCRRLRLFALGLGLGPGRALVRCEGRHVPHPTLHVHVVGTEQGVETLEVLVVRNVTADEGLATQRLLHLRHRVRHTSCSTASVLCQ
eukprot:Hpha_TRINITY_DN16287_c2_g6::TRINITY_DN16287_c2_g6_i1::g.11695::m.11695